MKYYECKVCGVDCIGLPLDGEIYDLEVCSEECAKQLESVEAMTGCEFTQVTNARALIAKVKGE